MTFLDPKSILFSVPTICDVLPDTERAEIEADRDPFYLHEDDWRQVEFVAGGDIIQVKKEMAALEAFKQANWTGAGWKSVYIRKERPGGLAPIGLSFAVIDAIPHDSLRDLMIGTPTQATRVKYGFATRIGESDVIYGRYFQHNLMDLGLMRLPPEDDRVALNNLFSLCRKYDLLVVDWCGGRIISELSSSEIVASNPGN